MIFGAVFFLSEVTSDVNYLLAVNMVMVVAMLVGMSMRKWKWAFPESAKYKYIIGQYRDARAILEQIG
jgi:hypothetical protein